jgi:hypothetical protein
VGDTHSVAAEVLKTVAVRLAAVFRAQVSYAGADRPVGGGGYEMCILIDRAQETLTRMKLDLYPTRLSFGRKPNDN